MNKTVYTSLDGFRLKKRDVKSYLCLGEEYVDWINEKSADLICNRNYPELRAGDELSRFTDDLHEQVFFMINGRSYFLDYFIPHLKLAIEIDGGYHKTRTDGDRLRDMDFSELGIRTIRIKASSVVSGKFIDDVRNKLSVKKKKARTKKKVEKGRNKRYFGWAVPPCVEDKSLHKLL